MGFENYLEEILCSKQVNEREKLPKINNQGKAVIPLAIPAKIKKC